MSSPDSPQRSFPSGVVRALLWTVVAAGVAGLLARWAGWDLEPVLWHGTNWSSFLPRLAVFMAGWGLILPLLGKQHWKAWLSVTGLAVLAAVIRAVWVGAEPLAPTDPAFVIGTVAESLAWLVLAIAATLGLYAWLCRPRLEAQAPLGTAIAAEESYLRDRRQLAKIPETPSNKGPVALALSGGGVRSATTNLGVLQALARLGIMPHVDYLSTVSGGGYVGAALSSLLSMRKPRAGEAPCGEDAQYEFEGDDSRFSVDEPTFPFGPAGANQVDHLRSSGEFLVGRSSVTSREFLRTVGTLVFGVLAHVAHFGLLAVSFAAFYLWIIWSMVGKFSTPDAPALTASDAGPGNALWLELAEYVRQAFGSAYEWGWGHPFVYAFSAGAIVTILAVWLGSWLIKVLDDDFFCAPGRTSKAIEGEASTRALIVVMILTAIVFTKWHIAQHGEDELLNISVPLISYLGGGFVLFVRHALIATFGASNRRDDRTRVGARAGAVIYAIVVSLVFVLLVLPFLLLFDDLAAGFFGTQPALEVLVGPPAPDEQVLLVREMAKGVAAWLLSLVSAWFLARGTDTEPSERRGRGGLASVVPLLKRALGALAFVIAVLGAFLLICVALWNVDPGRRFAIALGSLGVYCLLGWVLDFNKLSLHYFYRDRLVEAYLMTLESDLRYGNLRCVRNNEEIKLSQLHGVKAGKAAEAATAAPYHLIVTCLNLSSGHDRKGRSRKSDQFVFSKLYSGSETTGYVETASHFGDETLARAMTISGAAASPAMGSRTSFVQAASMTLLNLRLGQWIENPGYTGRRWGAGVFWPNYLFREMLGSTDAQGRLVYLSDGGHAGDNLGICPLLKRRCRLILAVDAEEDGSYLFHSLNEALRQAEVDEGIEVDIRLDDLRPDPGSGRASRHWSVGLITYPAEKEPKHGWLVVLKPSLSGDEPEPIINYQRENPSFPQQSTGDQFFDEAQFESYRELGRHMVASCRQGLLSRLLRNPASPELARRWRIGG